MIAFMISVESVGELANCALVLLAACVTSSSDLSSFPLMTLFT